MVLLMWATVTTILCGSGVLLAATSVARAETTFVVSSTSDSADINLKDGSCDADESGKNNG